MGNIAVIRPSEDVEPIYPVPENRDIGVFALSQGVPTFGSIVQVDRGRHEDHAFILNAGYVRVSTDQSGNSFPSIWHVPTDGEIDFDDRLPNGTTFLLPAGERTFQVGRGLGKVTQTIVVMAGETHDLYIAYERAPLSIRVQSAFPPQHLRPLSIWVDGRGAAQLLLGGETFDVGLWPLGTYRAVLERDAWRFPPVRPARSDPFMVQIERGSNEASVTLSLIGIEADISDWGNQMGEHARALVFSTSDSGAPFAVRFFDDIGRAPLVFLPPDNAHTYAVAVAYGDQILALAEVGSLSADTQHRVTLEQGGSRDLCDAIAAGFDCSALLPSPDN